jgi:hypothetical protein
MRILAAALGALALAAPAQAARYAVGLQKGASPEAVAARLDGKVSRELLDLRALVVEVPTARGIAGLPGVAYVERLDRSRRLSWVPPDPFVSRQWYLERIHAFDAWSEPPPLAGPLVAIIDSGIDAAGSPKAAASPAATGRPTSRATGRSSRGLSPPRTTGRAWQASPSPPSCSSRRSSAPTARSASRPR